MINDVVILLYHIEKGVFMFSEHKKVFLTSIVILVFVATAIIIVGFQNNYDFGYIISQTIGNNLSEESSSESNDVALKGELNFTLNLEQYSSNSMPPQNYIDLNDIPHNYPSDFEISKTEIYKIASNHYVVKEMKTSRDNKKSLVLYVSNKNEIPGIDFELFNKISPTVINDIEIYSFEQIIDDNKILCAKYIDKNELICVVMIKNGETADLNYIIKRNY